MAWQYNKKVLATFTYHGAQWAWANIETLVGGASRTAPPMGSRTCRCCSTRPAPMRASSTSRSMHRT